MDQPLLVVRGSQDQRLSDLLFQLLYCGGSRDSRKLKWAGYTDRGRYDLKVEGKLLGRRGGCIVRVGAGGVGRHYGCWPLDVEVDLGYRRYGC